MKRLTKFLAVAVGAVIFINSTTLIFAATLSLDPATGTFNKGCPVSIKVNTDSAGGQVDGIDVVIKYPTGTFKTSPSQIATNTSLFPEFPGTSVNELTGEINISGQASQTTPFTSSGTVATINFTIASDAPSGSANLKIDFDPNDKAKTTDSNVIEHNTLADLLSQVTDGSYTIGTGSCGSSASPSPSSSPATQVIYQPAQGGGLASPAPSVDPGLYKKLPTELPQGGVSLPTIVFASLGSLLVIAGIFGVAIL